MKTRLTGNRTFWISALTLWFICVLAVGLFAQDPMPPENIIMPPEIDVQQNGTSIPSGTGEFDFGSSAVGGDSSVSFSISNLGGPESVLILQGTPYVSITGTNPGDFEVTSQPSSQFVSMGMPASFTIKFTPGASGARQATVSIPNNDFNENPYTFTIKGTGESPTYYVDSTKADDSGDGLSWDNAKQTLQAALDLATSGDKIWVKAGTYFPTSAYDLTNTSRYFHFRMKNGVAIYGGFAGTESAVSERANYGMGEANETILSGDFNQDDVVTGSGQTLSFSNNSENCFHVFYHPSGLGLDTTAVLDGFTVRGGNASDPGLLHITGAGMYNQLNSPSLNSVNIIYNYAYYTAAGMFNDTSSPVITNSNISWNKSYSQAGGMYNLSSNPSLTNTMVLNNYAESYGGGIINQNNADPVFTNVLIAGNYSNSGGGGIYNHTEVSPIFINVTITNNAANGGGGGVRNWFGSSGTYFNCIIYGNTGIAGNEFYLENGMAPAGTVTLNYSCYGNATRDVFNIGTTFTATNNNITSNPLIVDAAGGDYRIYNVSPCADAGYDAYNSETTDIRGAGFDRKLNKTNGSAGTIDMGAYEYKFGTDPVAVPEIDVRGNYLSIADGDTISSADDSTSFGSANVDGGTINSTFKIFNTGNDILFLSQPDKAEMDMYRSRLNQTGPSEIVTISGDHSVDFEVTTQPSVAYLEPGDSASFMVQFDPSSNGTRSATVSIPNNDSDESPYTFAIQGIGLAAEIDVHGNYVSIVDGDASPSLTDHTDFDSVAVSNGDLERTYSIYNTGNKTLYLGNSQSDARNEKPVTIELENPVVIGGTNSADFTVTQAPSLEISPGDSTTFTVKFDPSGNGVRSATISIYSDDSDESPYNFSIQGFGAVPEIDIQGNYVSIANGDETPSQADHTDFDSVGVLLGSMDRTFKIFNTGTASLVLGQIITHTDNSLRNSRPIDLVTISGDNAADFTVKTQPTSPIAVGDSASFVVTFNPSDSGERRATVSLYSNDGDESPYTFAILGAGVTPTIEVRGNYTTIANGDTVPSFLDFTDFDSVSVVSDSSTHIFTILNTGTATLHFNPIVKNADAVSRVNFIDRDNVNIGGDHASDFTVTTQPSDSVAAGDSTTFTVAFNPSAVGIRSASIDINSDDFSNSPYTFAIRGTGVTPEIDVRGNYISIANGDTTPSATDSTSFGSAAVDGGTINRTFRIFNTGNERLYLGDRDSNMELAGFTMNSPSGRALILLKGPQGYDFEVTAQPENFYINPGDSLSFTIQFNPSDGGTRSTYVYVRNNDSDESDFNFEIEGVGITVPTVVTAAIDSITVISAVGGGNVTADGGDSVTVRGVCWGLTANPTVDSSHTSNGDGTGSFSSSITGLAHGITYYVRAYATNGAGTGYGADSTFTTKQILITTTPSDTLLRGGQQVTYTVSIANVLPAMRGFSVQVDFNDDHFTSPQFTEGTFLSSTGKTTQWDASGANGRYTVDCAILGVTDGVTGDGTLFTMMLTTADAVTDSLVNPSSDNLMLSHVLLRDVNNIAIPCDSSAGSKIIIDTAPPTMDSLAEADSVWYRSQPVLQVFRVADNYELDSLSYKLNDDAWTTIMGGIKGKTASASNAPLPGYAELAERKALHWFYLRACDDAGNLGGYDKTWDFCFYKDETAPLGDLSISFKDVAAYSMKVVGAALADTTQGEEYYQFDCTTNDTYDRARTLADSIHECATMAANTQYKFKYQGSDGVNDPGATPAYNATSWSNEYSKYTLSVAPTTSTVTCDKHGTISTTTLTFTAVGGFGAGTVQYYLYALDDSIAHTFKGTESEWASGDLKMGIPTANKNYYLHVQGYNAEDVANGTLTIGPYQWDGTPISPVTKLELSTSGNSLQCSWTNPQNDAYKIEVWFKGFGGYPEYTGAVPTFPTTPDEASGDGWTKILDSLATSKKYAPANRDFYYYALFVEDMAKHYSAAAIDSSLSYWLGDVNASPDGSVTASDIAILSSAYHTSSIDADWNGHCDVGPTLDFGRISRPLPDDDINFEDLMIFAMNYENTSKDKTDKSKAKVTSSPIALLLNIQRVGAQFVAQVQLNENAGVVKGLYIPITFGADLSFSQVRRGSLVTSGDFFDAGQEGNCLYISAAALEHEGIFKDNGVVAEIVFTVNGSNSSIQFGEAVARSQGNANLELTYAYTDVALLSEGLIPTEYKLHQNYPNPFNPSTTILYDLKADGQVTITLYNINGQRIATLLDEVKNAGYHSFVFEAGNLPSGVYLYRIQVNDFRDVRKLVLMK
ncbi:MAG: choice-of-anchor D domain-containing protein [Candidatus Zhuqueibacterota bacterium]